MWTATHRFARISPLKVRWIMKLIRGRRCADALEQLRFNRRRSSRYVHSVLSSAMSNASEKEADVSRLVITDARVDCGPAYKRWQPKDRGRAHPILKRTSHITVTVEES